MELSVVRTLRVSMQSTMTVKSATRKNRVESDDNFSLYR